MARLRPANTICAHEVDKAAIVLAGASHPFVFTGAGISQASGIPTYRDTNGCWMVGKNRSYAHVAALRDDARGFDRFWAARCKDCQTANPNSAHYALGTLQRLNPSAYVVTQNVDGLLQRAGCADVLELHGNLQEWRCESCGLRRRRAYMGLCLGCMQRMRPNIVLFGETVSRHLLYLAKARALHSDVMLVVGTSAEVHPAAELPLLAMQHGATVIVVDPITPGVLQDANFVLVSKAEEVLPVLIAKVALYRDAPRH